ncbi:VanZ family protein [Aureivirga marina]|uniref:VanZ family protein n=1 Tax=Aureivirga marina TaxID=1182451 RepID=UPI0018CAB3F2|nr:VanZ family protein [Aureivirga marina]
MRIKKLLERNALIITILITISVVVISIVPTDSIQVSVKTKGTDKIAHVLMYFILTFFWLLTFNLSFKKRNFNTLLLITIAIFGMFIEILQETITESREFDWYDGLANTLGVLIAFVFFNILHRKFGTREI